MRSKAKIAGHPIHPMLIPLPIGLFVGAIVADVLYQTSGNVFWYDVAWWTMAGGVVTALLAAVPGLIDYFAVARRTRARTTATVHMALNLTVVALYAVNLYIRNDHGALAGGTWGLAFGLDILAAGMLSASGWLGGELVYRFGIGFGREAMRISMLDEDRVTLERADEEHQLR